jgi:hypothetical protein
VVYGVAIAADGRRLALVTGVEPQWLLTYERTEDRYELDVAEQMGTDLRRSVDMAFGADGSMVAAGANGELLVAGPRGKTLRRIPMPGRAVSLYPLVHGIMCAIGHDRGAVASFYLVDRHGRPVLSHAMGGSPIGLYPVGSHFLFATDTRISLWALEMR